jgi:hypothetical protein
MHAQLPNFLSTSFISVLSNIHAVLSAGNKYVRQFIWMLSVFAVQRVTRYREYFKRRVGEGKAKMHILVAVGWKLLSAL